MLKCNEPMGKVYHYSHREDVLRDLWAFNEEIVARAIFQSDIPVISAGHKQILLYQILRFKSSNPSAAANWQFLLKDLNIQ